MLYYVITAAAKNCILPICLSGVKIYSSVADQKLLDHNDNGLKRWKYEMEGSLSRFGLGSFENLLNQFQVISRKGMARSNIPNKQDAKFTQHFQYFSQVIINSLISQFLVTKLILVMFKYAQLEISLNNFSTLEAVAWRCSVKKIFLENSQNSQENACARVSFLTKLQVSGLQLY